MFEGNFTGVSGYTCFEINSHSAISMLYRTPQLVQICTEKLRSFLTMKLKSDRIETFTGCSLVYEFYKKRNKNVEIGN